MKKLSFFKSYKYEYEKQYKKIKKESVSNNWFTSPIYVIGNQQ